MYLTVKLARKSVFIKNFKKHKLAKWGLVFIIFEILLVTFLPVLMHLDPLKSNMLFNSAPSTANWFGTDDIGRDLFARVIYGGRVSLIVGFVSIIISVAIGLPLGLLAGYYRGILGTIIMRAADVFMSIPTMILALVIITVFAPSIANITIVIGIIGWPAIARLIYGNVLSVSKKDYVESARAIGTKNIGILIKYILPNSVAPLWMIIAFRISQAIMTEAGLSFLGAGVQPPDASWGNIIYAAQSLVVLTTRPWVWLPPGILLLLTVVSINLVGEGIRDALDPKMKR